MRRSAARGLKNVAKVFDLASHKVAPPASTFALEGDRDLEWTFCQARLPDGPCRTLDFGADTGVPVSLSAALRGHDVTAFDQLEARGRIDHPGIRRVTADILDRPLAGESFDLIVNCSSIEHVGLAGRYGSRDAGDGDLEAMAVLGELMAPDARHILTLPVGRDMVCAPQHRIYGEQRLPLLLDGYEIVEEQFWHTPAGTWTPTDRSTALATQGSREFYSLGLFVLRRAA